MLDPRLSVEEYLAFFRARLRASPIPAVLLPDAILPPTADALRKTLLPRLTPFEIADRGRYRVADDLATPTLAARLADLAARLLERPLRPGPLRCLRFAAGDYLLTLGDDARHLPAHVELTCDLSAAACDDAAVTYLQRTASGERSVFLPHAPRSITVVERAPGTSRWERYLTHSRCAMSEVVRLRLTLLPA